MEWQLYQTFVGPVMDTVTPPPSFSNGAECCTSSLYKNTYDKETGKGTIETIGVSGKVKRGIEINF